MLTNSEIKRYSRQIILPEIGIGRQSKLKNAKVLVVGAGGLGSPVLLYLAAAGIGTIGIADFDNVDETNLQRQILYGENDLLSKKTDAAKIRLEKINSNIKINQHNAALSDENAQEIIKGYDIVVECTDSLDAKYAANDACVKYGKPMVYGSVSKFNGQAAVFNYNNGACLRCMLPEKPNGVLSCSQEGVLGVVPGLIGMVQATEAIKIILGIGSTLSGRLIAYNALTMSFEGYKLNKSKSCKCNKITSKNNITKIKPDNEIDVKSLRQMMNNNKEFILIDVREEEEYNQSRINNSKLVPLSRIASGDFSGFDGIDKDKNIVLHCKSGGRSLAALGILKSMGFKHLHSLKGGILAWAEEAEGCVKGDIKNENIK